MRFLSKTLFVFVTLMLCSTALAEPTFDSVRKQLDQHESYSLKLDGRDDNGEFTATYYYSPDLSVLKRSDRTGKLVYVHDRLKRPDKVMVNRHGVAYLYSLDNPRLPSHFPDAFLEHYLEVASSSGVRPEIRSNGREALVLKTGERELILVLAPEGDDSVVELDDFPPTSDVYAITSLLFEPDLESLRLLKFARYLRK